MANAGVLYAQAAANLKPVFGQLQAWIPSFAILQKRFSFSPRDTVGRYFEEPLEVRQSMAMTFAGTPSAGTSILNLQDATPFVYADIQIEPVMLLNRIQVDLRQADQAPEGGFDQAFQGLATLAATSMTSAIRRQLEMGILYGQDGFGEAESWDDSADTVVIKQPTFSPGFTAFLEGASINVVQSGTLVSAPTAPTLRNISLTVSSVNLDTRTLTFSGTPNLSSLAAGDVLVMSGSWGQPGGTGTAMEQLGLRRQISLQTGTVFNVAKQTYSAYRGNVVAVDGPVSAGAILNLATKSINRGAEGELLAVLPTRAWNVLNSQVQSLMAFNQQSPSVAVKVDLGAGQITLKGPNVSVECIAHPMMKEGEIMVLPVGENKDAIIRIGSLYGIASKRAPRSADKKLDGPDISFVKALTTDEYIWDVPDKLAIELQVRTNQQVYLRRCAWATLGTGFTY